MLPHKLNHFDLPNPLWNDQPDPAELAALEDIRAEGWFDREEPLLVTLLDLVEAVASVSETQDEVVATVAYMLQSESVALRGDPPAVPAATTALH